MSELNNKAGEEDWSDVVRNTNNVDWQSRLYTVMARQRQPHALSFVVVSGRGNARSRRPTCPGRCGLTTHQH